MAHAITHKHLDFEAHSVDIIFIHRLKYGNTNVNKNVLKFI